MRRRATPSRSSDARRQVHGAHRIGDTRRPGQPVERRRGSTNGTRVVRLVDEEAVRRLAVLVEALAVIADDRDHRSLISPCAIQELDAGARAASRRTRSRRCKGGLAYRSGAARADRTACARRRNAATRRTAGPFAVLDPRQRSIGDDLVGRPLDGAAQAAHSFAVSKSST